MGEKKQNHWGELCTTCESTSFTPFRDASGIGFIEEGQVAGSGYPNAQAAGAFLDGVLWARSQDEEE